MIRQHNLRPGKMMLHRSIIETYDTYGCRRYVEHWHACIVVGFVSDIKRRHAKSTASIEGWDVLVLWTGGRHGHVYDVINIKPGSKDWRSAW